MNNTYMGHFELEVLGRLERVIESHAEELWKPWPFYGPNPLDFMSPNLKELYSWSKRDARNRIEEYMLQQHPYIRYQVTLGRHLSRKTGCMYVKFKD